ncbi:hypothetical protein PIB30_032019 [Stylosanthes scabra]|uniref:Uncharacterized protein n=1 Tax=Stylosanthes scabra TaxID=79078 RepID=A0ABU6WF26_9FABA|nr:hypothetical protein [Stylosanthes scabra]
MTSDLRIAKRTALHHNSDSRSQGIKHLPNFYHLPSAKTITDLGIGVPCRYTPNLFQRRLTEVAFWARQEAGFWVPYVTLAPLPGTSGSCSGGITSLSTKMEEQHLSPILINEEGAMITMLI